MLLQTQLTIPNDLNYINFANQYINEVLEKCLFKANRINKIKLALEESLTNIIKYAFESDDLEEINISAFIENTDLVISIRDNGRPYDFLHSENYNPSELSEESEINFDDLSTFLIKQSVDVVSSNNLGRNGNELRLQVSLPAEKISEIADINRIKELEQEAPPSEENIVEYRQINPEEAIEVSKCIYTSYGRSYVNEDLYYPEKVVELNRIGTITSIVGISESGEIAGHIALIKPSPTSNIVEWGIAVTKHKFRGKGLMNMLFENAEKKALEMSFKGFFAHCVTEHPYTQKICNKFGFKDTAIAFGYSPLNVTYRKMSETLTQRQTIVFGYKYLCKLEAQRLYLPSKHKEIISTLYQSLEQSIIALPAEDIKIPDKSVYKVDYYNNRNTAFITINEYGINIIDEIAKEIKNICYEKIDIIYLNLNLENLCTAHFCEKLEELGFVFSGLLPGEPFENTLILQYFNNIRFDYDKIDIYSEQAKILFKYITDAIDKINSFN